MSGNYRDLWPKITRAELHHLQQNRQSKGNNCADILARDSEKSTVKSWYHQVIVGVVVPGASPALTNILPLLDDLVQGRVEIKSESRANKHRSAGNTLFIRGEYCQAASEYRRALLYTKSVAGGSETLVYSNLSACCLHLGEWRDCLESARLVMTSSGFSTDVGSRLMGKLAGRVKQCLEKVLSLGLLNSASMAEMVQLLADWTTITANQKLLLQTLESALSLLPATMSSAAGLSDNDDGNKPSSVKWAVSGKGLVEDSKTEYGRLVRATCTLNPGDVLLTEPAFTSVVLRPHRHSVCYRCLRSLRVPLPCRGCAAALFCSETCRHVETQERHQFECKAMFLLDCIGVGHLAARLLLSETRAGYGEVEALMDHFQNFPVEDLFEYGLTAWLIDHILSSTGWTPRAAGDHYSVGSRAFRHLLQLQCNAHAVTAVLPTIDDATLHLDTLEQTRIGTAIYPAASLLNHSCQPSVVNSFHGDWLVLRATMSLKPNEEIFNCYGPHYLRTDWSTRQTDLRSQYFFTCQCCHCSNQDSKLTFLTAFQCTRCLGPCYLPGDSGVGSQCGLPPPSSLQIQLAEAAANQDPRAILILHSRLMHPDSRLLAESLDRAALWLANSGQWEEACDLVRRNLARTRRVFGDFSPEVGWEAVKLAGLFEKRGCREGSQGATVAWAEANAAFERNYGVKWTEEMMAIFRR